MTMQGAAVDPHTDDSHESQDWKAAAAAGDHL